MAALLTDKTRVEDAIDSTAHAIIERLQGGRTPRFIIEFLVFGLKQAWACMFGGLMLVLVIATSLWFPTDASVYRYDALFVSAITIQVAMLAFRLESLEEAKVILIFHFIGTVMEVFKTHVGSWIYPEPAVFRIGGVPLFTGFMYAAVGSYIARVWRIFDMRFSAYPPMWQTVVLASLIYINFFSHHFVPDIRFGLFAGTCLLFWRTRVHYRVFQYRLWMPMLLGFGLVALFIWFAENIGTKTRTWLYPDQLTGWSPVSLAKLGSWFLLMIISFVLVSTIHKPQPPDR